jgi:L(+)-tartrate dehydratase beta subunit
MASESRSNELRLTFPLTDLDALRELEAGQTLRIDGTVIGIRDATQIAMFDRGEKPRMDLRGAALIHTAPNVRKLGPGQYEKVCIGTTTSARMDRFTRGLMEQYGVRAIIGKGGLLAGSLPVLREYGGVYLAITGGAAALETRQIESIEDVEFEELMPECLWKFRVRDFGPLTVAMDSRGRSLYEEVQEGARARLEELAARLWGHAVMGGQGGRPPHWCCRAARRERVV